MVSTGVLFLGDSLEQLIFRLQRLLMRVAGMEMFPAAGRPKYSGKQVRNQLGWTREQSSVCDVWVWFLCGPNGRTSQDGQTPGRRREAQGDLGSWKVKATGCRQESTFEHQFLVELSVPCWRKLIRWKLNSWDQSAPPTIGRCNDLSS